MAVVKSLFRSAIRVAALWVLLAGTTVAASGSEDGPRARSDASVLPEENAGLTAPAEDETDAQATSTESLPTDLPERDAAALSGRLEGLNSFAASFIQAIAGNRGQILEESTGFVLLSRPNFKWVVDDPYPQVIVTEGDQLKVYDPDLEQLTIRPLAQALTDTPISLLTQAEVNLSAEFLVIRLPVQEEGIDSYIVSPRGEDSLFAEIRLTFSPTGLDSLGIVDHLGQYTEIRFEVDPDRVIQSADFELVVPPGTDVIGG